MDGKQSKFQAFVVFFLLVYVNVNRNKQQKLIIILSKTTYILNDVHLNQNVICFENNFYSRSEVSD